MWGMYEVRYPTLVPQCTQLVVGTGFHTRSAQDEDVDDELDVDGEEGFGEPQFTEGDILPITHPGPTVNQDVEVEIEGDIEDEAQREQKTLRDLVAEGKVVQNISHARLDPVRTEMEQVISVADTDGMDFAILAARRKGDKSSLITALEAKVKQLVIRTLTPSLWLQLKSSHSGSNTCLILHVFALSDMSRSIQRTDHLDRMLAHMLQRVLASLSWLHQTVSNLQTHHRSD